MCVFQAIEADKVQQVMLELADLPPLKTDTGLETSFLLNHDLLLSCDSRNLHCLAHILTSVMEPCIVDFVPILKPAC